MDGPFDAHYEFTIGEDYYYPVHDYTIAELNRPHKFSDIEDGLNKISYNWECIDEDDGLRRGGSKLYLLNDQYYIACSRTGLERAGNAIRVSKDTPEQIRFTILKTVFENIFTRKLGDIRDGIDKSNFFSGKDFNIASPKEFVLADKLTQDEITEYYDELADLTMELVEKYHNITTTDELKNIVDWYDNERRNLYRDYTDFQPSILSQTIPQLNSKNNWRIPKDIDEGKSLTVLLHEWSQTTPDGLKQLVIEISEMGEQNNIYLMIDEEDDTTIIKENTYETTTELETLINSYMEETPETLNLT